MFKKKQQEKSEVKMVAKEPRLVDECFVEPSKLKVYHAGVQQVIQVSRLDRVREENHLQLLLEKDPTPLVTPIRARLVTDGERIVLQLQTPDTGAEFRPVARIEVRGGKIVMFREKGVKSGLINTDEEGRIQN